MRRIKPEFEFDIWMPVLSPSTKLLKSYHDKAINWEQFENIFTKQVLDKQQEYLEIIIQVCKKNKVTLLCWEEKGENCHRLLIAKRIKKLNPEVNIKNL